jgi:hypothetical protein
VSPNLISQATQDLVATRTRRFREALPKCSQVLFFVHVLSAAEECFAIQVERTRVARRTPGTEHPRKTATVRSGPRADGAFSIVALRCSGCDNHFCGDQPMEVALPFTVNGIFSRAIAAKAASGTMWTPPLSTRPANRLRRNANAFRSVARSGKITMTITVILPGIFRSRLARCALFAGWVYSQGTFCEKTRWLSTPNLQNALANPLIPCDNRPTNCFATHASENIASDRSDIFFADQ